MQALSIDAFVWLSVFICISQSAMFSGLNLALLGISRLRLEVEASAGNANAIKILNLRKDSNFLLTTILWGNVGINVLLTILSQSVMTGLVAFLFSTFLITFVGEIFPQAYFSRHAMRMGALLSPVLKIYQILLYPVAKPSALILDMWLGKEGIQYFKESDLNAVIRKHIDSGESDVGHTEGVGAINFLALDDISVTQEGQSVDPESIITLPISGDLPEFPSFQRNINDPFLKDVNRSGKKWVIIVDEHGLPGLVLNANAFLRDALMGVDIVNPYTYCHRPIVVNDANTLLGKVVSRLEVDATSEADDVVDNDLILLWSDQKRVITGADILGRLLRGISHRDVINRFV